MRLRIVAALTTACALAFLTAALLITVQRVNRLTDEVEALRHEVRGLWAMALVEPASNDRDE